ncbi:hypothetical protein [Clostridium sp. Marseille-QA1073]
MIFKYLIVYQLQKGSCKELKNVDINLSKKIDSIQDIWNIERFLRKSEEGLITILNYKLLSKSKKYILTKM